MRMTFKLRGDIKPTVDGTVPIYLKVFYEGKPNWLNTYIRIDPVFLSSKMDVKKTHPLAKPLNHKLSKIMTKAHSILLKMEEEEMEFDFTTFRELMQNKGGEVLLIKRAYAFIEKNTAKNQEERKLGKFTPSTAETYRLKIELFEKFLKGEDIYVKKINNKLLQQYYQFCLAQPMIPDTAKQYVNRIESFYREACKHFGIAYKEFETIKTPSREKENKVLSESEIQLIESIIRKGYYPRKGEQLPEKISPIRLEKLERFLFLIYTGIRYSDVQDLKFEHLKQIDDKWFIQKVFIKSNKESTIPLVPKAYKLINFDKHIRPKSLVFKMEDISNYRTVLKKTINEIGIHKNVTPHWARYTHNTFLKDRGVDRAVRSKILTHTNENTTKIYEHTKDDPIKLYDSIVHHFENL